MRSPILEKFTLTTAWPTASLKIEEIDRARQMAGLMQQMANTCVNSIQQRIGTLYA